MFYNNRDQLCYTPTLVISSQTRVNLSVQRLMRLC